MLETKKSWELNQSKGWCRRKYEIWEAEGWKMQTSSYQLYPFTSGSQVYLLWILLKKGKKKKVYLLSRSFRSMTWIHSLKVLLFRDILFFQYISMAVFKKSLYNYVFISFSLPPLHDTALNSSACKPPLRIRHMNFGVPKEWRIQLMDFAVVFWATRQEKNNQISHVKMQSDVTFIVP